MEIAQIPTREKKIFGEFPRLLIRVLNVHFQAESVGNVEELTVCQFHDRILSIFWSKSRALGQQKWEIRYVVKVASKIASYNVVVVPKEYRLGSADGTHPAIRFGTPNQAFLGSNAAK